MRPICNRHGAGDVGENADETVGEGAVAARLLLTVVLAEYGMTMAVVQGFEWDLATLAMLTRPLPSEGTAAENWRTHQEEWLRRLERFPAQKLWKETAP